MIYSPACCAVPAKTTVTAAAGTALTTALELITGVTNVFNYLTVSDKKLCSVVVNKANAIIAGSITLATAAITATSPAATAADTASTGRLFQHGPRRLNDAKTAVFCGCYSPTQVTLMAMATGVTVRPAQG